MKAFLLTSVAANGGSAATAYHTTRTLLQQGWQALLFAPGAYWLERGRDEHIPVADSLQLRRGFHAASFWRDFRTLRAAVLADQPDVLIVQKSPEQWLAALVLMSIRRPIALVRLRGVVFAIRPTGFNRWLHNRMAAVLCSASVIAKQYQALPGFQTGRVAVLLEGVDTGRYVPATPERRAGLRAHWKLDPEALIFGTAGRPAPVKGHDVLVQAFAKAFGAQEATATGRQARLCIFVDESRRGPGSYASLDGLCRQLGVAERVDFRPGFVEEMSAVYGCLDAYVLPSRGSEGSSRAGLEASACGLPLIASNVGVLPDLVEDGRTGRLVPPGDADALALVLRDFAQNWPACRALGAAARARMLQDFNEAQYASKLSKLLTEAIG